MILDQMLLKNFGLYAGSQAITLTPPSPERPVVLIGGLNGGGKTTLLDALQLGLFGPHAKISNRGTLGYQEYLSRSIHHGKSASEAAIEIRFRYTIEGREEQYRLHRSWRRNGKGCTEHVEVRKNGVLEPTLADNWASQVEEFFPGQYCPSVFVRWRAGGSLRDKRGFICVDWSRDTEPARPRYG